MKEKCDGCYACYLLGELYDQVEQTNRNYYVMTELLVLLHGGKDCCNPVVQDSELDEMIDRRKARFEMADVECETSNVKSET